MFLINTPFCFPGRCFCRKKNPRRARRHSRKGVGPKAPGAHRAHGPRPIGPIRSHAAACSHAVAWVRDRPGPSNCMAAYGPYGPQGPWTMGPMGPRGLGPNHFASLSQNYFVFSRILGVPKIKKTIFHENRRNFADFCYFGKC